MQKLNVAQLILLQCALHAGSGEIPSDETEIAFDMLTALIDFFNQHKILQKRPFIITGESYAGDNPLLMCLYRGFSLIWC